MDGNGVLVEYCELTIIFRLYATATKHIQRHIYLTKFHQTIMLKIIFVNTISNSSLKINGKFSYEKELLF